MLNINTEILPLLDEFKYSIDLSNRTITMPDSPHVAIVNTTYNNEIKSITIDLTNNNYLYIEAIYDGFRIVKYIYNPATDEFSTFDCGRTFRYNETNTVFMLLNQQHNININEAIYHKIGSRSFVWAAV